MDNANDRSGDQSQDHTQLSAILGEFLNRARLPQLNDLSNDFDCYICCETFLSGKKPEFPVKLQCGHVVGSGCIVRWLLPQGQRARNTCPECRNPILEGVAMHVLDEIDLNREAAREADGVEALERYLEQNQNDYRQRQAEANRQQLQRMREYRARSHADAAPIDSTLFPATPSAAANRAPRALVTAQYDGRLDREIAADADRLIWLKFCEGVVQHVEASNDRHAQNAAPLAHALLDLQSASAFRHLRQHQPATYDAYRNIFGQLFNNAALDTPSSRAVADINIDHIMARERNSELTLTQIHQTTIGMWKQRIQLRISRVRSNSRSSTPDITGHSSDPVTFFNPNPRYTYTVGNSPPQRPPPTVAGRPAFPQMRSGRDLFPSTAPTLFAPPPDRRVNARPAVRLPGVAHNQTTDTNPTLVAPPTLEPAHGFSRIVTSRPSTAATRIKAPPIVPSQPVIHNPPPNPPSSITDLPPPTSAVSPSSTLSPSLLQQLHPHPSPRRTDTPIPSPGLQSRLNRQVPSNAPSAPSSTASNIDTASDTALGSGRSTALFNLARPGGPTASTVPSAFGGPASRPNQPFFGFGFSAAAAGGNAAAQAAEENSEEEL